MLTQQLRSPLALSWDACDPSCCVDRCASVGRAFRSRLLARAAYGSQSGKGRCQRSAISVGNGLGLPVVVVPTARGIMLNALIVSIEARKEIGDLLDLQWDNRPGPWSLRTRREPTGRAGRIRCPEATPIEGKSRSMTGRRSRRGRQHVPVCRSVLKLIDPVSLDNYGGALTVTSTWAAFTADTLHEIIPFSPIRSNIGKHLKHRRPLKNVLTLWQTPSLTIAFFSCTLYVGCYV